MKIDIRYFASLRETVGVSNETLILPPEVVTVGGLREFLRSRGDTWQAALEPRRALRMACNLQMCDASAALSDGCEIAFFPPVTGG